MNASDSVVARPSRTIEAEIAGAHVHSTQTCRSEEHVYQTYIIHDKEIMSEGAELDMDKPCAFRRVYGMRRLLARGPSAGLGILDEHAK